MHLIDNTKEISQNIGNNLNQAANSLSVVSEVKEAVVAKDITKAGVVSGLAALSISSSGGAGVKLNMKTIQNMANAGM